MAERLAQHNAKLADEVMAIIIAQMRSETEDNLKYDVNEDDSLLTAVLNTNENDKDSVRDRGLIEQPSGRYSVNRGDVDHLRQDQANSP